MPQRRLDPRAGHALEADCSLEDEYTFSFPPTQLIQIDIDPQELGRNYPVAIGAIADLKPALAALTRVARRLVPAGVKRPELLAEMADNRGLRRRQSGGDEERRLADAPRAHPRRPARGASDAILCTDVGWNKNGVGQQFPIYEPGSIFTPGGFATMGFGSPAALGAKIALPDRVVIALIGDGGFGQNPAALATAFENDIAVGMGDQQLCLRHHRRSGGGSLRHHLRHRVREGRQTVLARLRPRAPTGLMA